MLREQIDAYAAAAIEAERLRCNLVFGVDPDRRVSAYCSVPDERTLRTIAEKVSAPVRDASTAAVKRLDVLYKDVTFCFRQLTAKEER